MRKLPRGNSTGEICLWAWEACMVRRILFQQRVHQHLRECFQRNPNAEKTEVQQPLDVNCCPPLSQKIIDYKLPPITKMRFRPAAHLASQEYIAKYEKAVELMKALPEDDPRSFMQQANRDGPECLDVGGLLRSKYVTGDKPDPGPGTVERGSHTALHVWVGQATPSGEDMGNFYSAGREPLFFSHHANVDRLWSIWRGLRGPKPKDFPESDWLNANFLFYDENAQLVRVKVADTLENQKMGFVWQEVDLPWLNNRPTARVKKSKVSTTTAAPKATETVFPVKLDKVKVLVDRPKKIQEQKGQGKRRRITSDRRDRGGHREIRELLEDLDVEDDDKILVSLVPRAGGEDITIGGIKIIYAS
ncbi:UNVERIFIED_CONTAM: Polyphenol oxidase I, chloroplastic [Sesamum calycinum]|uniref:Polyphenol oxidase I, chloroplastic n=1 Tax=Sesamum calycinum TaxID=2727403 RepID=A0AAW2Q493_9LAMI